MYYSLSQSLGSSSVMGGDIFLLLTSQFLTLNGEFLIL